MQKGPLSFDDLQDFFAGFPNGPPGCGPGQTNALGPCPGGSAATILTGNLLRHFTFDGFALFLQDDWRVTPKLTVNLGVRYELNTVPKERDNLQGNFDPVSGAVQVGSGTSPLITAITTISRRAWAWPGIFRATARPWSAQEADSFTSS